MSGSGIGVVDLKIENDVETELGLSKLPGGMRTLEFIADQGGEIGWNWDFAVSENGLMRPLSPATKNVVTALINMELLREREYVQGNAVAKLTLRLTDKGRNIVAKHRTMHVTAGVTREVSTEELLEQAKAQAAKLS